MTISEAQKRATLKYKNKTYKRIPFDVRIEEHEVIKEFAEAHGYSVNGMIRAAIHDYMSKHEDYPKKSV